MDYRCCINVFQEHEAHFPQLGSNFPHDLFNIDVEIRWISSHGHEATFDRSISVRRDLFLSKENGRNIIHSSVTDLSVPRELVDAIVPDILSFARDVNGFSMNLGRQVIELRVELLVEESLDDEIGELVDESMTSSVNFKPASKSAIKALKRVKWDDEDEGHLPLKKRRKLVEGLNSRKGCTVCLDELLDGDDVASMPCDHVYHYDCIVKWLERSHLCPLCRYHMPFD